MGRFGVQLASIPVSRLELKAIRTVMQSVLDYQFPYVPQTVSRKSHEEIVRWCDVLREMCVSLSTRSARNRPLRSLGYAFSWRPWSGDRLGVRQLSKHSFSSGMTMGHLARESRRVASHRVALCSVARVPQPPTPLVDARAGSQLQPRNWKGTMGEPSLSMHCCRCSEIDVDSRQLRPVND